MILNTYNTYDDQALHAECDFLFKYFDVRKEAGKSGARAAYHVCVHTACFEFRCRRGHPGVLLPRVIYNSANHWEGLQLETNPIIRNEPNWK